MAVGRVIGVKKVKGLVKTGPMANLRLEEVLQEDAGIPIYTIVIAFASFWSFCEKSVEVSNDPSSLMTSVLTELALKISLNDFSQNFFKKTGLTPTLLSCLDAMNNPPCQRDFSNEGLTPEMDPPTAHKLCHVPPYRALRSQ